MITLYNNYIFLQKEKQEDSLVTKEDKTNVINTRKNIDYYVKSIFGEPIDKNTEIIKFKFIYTYEVEIENKKYDVIFTIHNITHYSYLEVCVSGRTTNQVVNALEYIQSKIVDSDLENLYIMIVSYDAVSEYYCNKAYPKLNKLERNLRKLLFNTYTINFGVDYYEKTISPDLQNKIKGVIQAKGNEEKKKTERIKKFFYSMEFSDIQTLLFTKEWTKVEEENKVEFLSKHEKLTELSEEELRTAFNIFSPQSDWERLFADKIDSCEIEKMIEMVREARNDIAHCKFFYKEQYLSFSKLIIVLNNFIIKAIKLTEEKDFVEKQNEFFRIEFAGILEKATQFQKHINETIKNSISRLHPIFSALNEWKKQNIAKMFSDINFNICKTVTDYESMDWNDESETNDETDIE